MRNRNRNVGARYIAQPMLPEPDDERHRFFGSLRVHGEWFRYEDPLVSYVWTVAEAFYADFGLTLETWIQGLRDGSPFQLPRVAPSA